MLKSRFVVIQVVAQAIRCHFKINFKCNFKQALYVTLHKLYISVNGTAVETWAHYCIKLLGKTSLSTCISKDLIDDAAMTMRTLCVAMTRLCDGSKHTAGTSQLCSVRTCTLKPSAKLG